MIPKSECKDRHLYRIRSRNLGFGVYRASTGGFIGLREKFDAIFLFEEYHHDNGPPYGTVTPKMELVRLPDHIELKEGSSVCGKCGKPVAYVNWPEGGYREITMKSGGTISVMGEWQHLPPTSPCKKIDPVHRENKALHEWIDAQMTSFFANFPSWEANGTASNNRNNPTDLGNP